tara:strand:+ start:464 stop:742 length:279 start_codon:yes stop_codon:yes gene_type:complete
MFHTHSPLSADHRYLCYEDGSEEQHDLKADPNCRVNLAGKEDPQQIIETSSNDLPKTNAPYHPANSKPPINAWFNQHFAENGIGVKSECSAT